MRPSLSDLLATAQVVTLPLATPFRGVTERELLVFEGEHGWAEWSPFVEYEPAEAATWLAAAIDWAFEAPPEPVRSRIEINATLPAVSPHEVDQVLAKFGRFDTVKIKVAEPGQTIVDDLARAITVKAAYPKAKIRLDANGALSPDQALALVASLVNAEVNLEYFEQPCRSVEELAELRELLKSTNYKVAVAADESVRKASDPLAVAQAGAADLLVLKAAPLGGVTSALRIAQAAGLPVVISSALESSIGLAMGLHLAACIPNLEYACGLGTAALLAADLVDEPLLPTDGSLELQRPVPNQKLIDQNLADEDVTEWWRERLADAYAVLEREDN